MNRFFQTKPFTTFYVVFTYILIFALWWAYLLYEKNETAFIERVELNQIQFEGRYPDKEYMSTDSYLEIWKKYNRQRIMILTEGSVFILLLLIGLLRVRKVFLDEMKLAAQQRNFLLSVTHELKSPISTVKLSLQTMAKHNLDVEKQQKLVVNSLVDLDRLETLVENILFAAQIEREEHGLAFEDLNISEIANGIVDRFRMNKKSITVISDISPDTYIKADYIGFASVLTNLIENAIKYSPENSEVTISLTNEDGNVILAVADQGQGIRKADKERVFEKFYRVGNENTRKTKGTGLGLYIVKRFVEIYKGYITIEDNEPTGTIFRLVFKG